jgi:predicted RNase H-like HicB family nuclease
MEVREYTADVHFENGWYEAQVRELPSAFASGQTLDELREALFEAITMVLDEPRAADARVQTLTVTL